MDKPMDNFRLIAKARYSIKGSRITKVVPVLSRPSDLLTKTLDTSAHIN